MKIGELFDSAAETYDATRKKYIPCIDDFYGVAIEQIPFNQSDRFAVLDLGAGTGLLTAMISRAFPNAFFELADASEGMLEQAKARFGDDARFEYRKVDFGAEGVGSGFDIVISALAIHHVPQENLRDVFTRIFRALRKGGTFINADQILGESSEIEASYEAAWLRHARQAGCTEEEIEIAIKRMEADRTSPLSFQMKLLAETGFTGVNCWYQFYRYATYSGRRPR